METKKVNLQYLLDNDKWQLKVTPEQSEIVQLALFDIGVDWQAGDRKYVRNTDKRYLSRIGKSVYHGDYLDLETLELEQQALQYDFDTEQDLWCWLIDGKSVHYISDKENIVNLKVGFCNRVDGKPVYALSRPKDWKKVNWHDKLNGTVDNGRLCNIEIQNRIGSTRTARLIIDISYDDGLFYSDEGIAYDNATPLTNNEIKAFMVDDD